MAASTGQFAAKGQRSGNVSAEGEFNLSLYGDFEATVRLERSFDSGTTWLPVTNEAGLSYSWCAPVSLAANEPEAGVVYSLLCTDFTRGPVNWRLGS